MRYVLVCVLTCLVWGCEKENVQEVQFDYYKAVSKDLVKTIETNATVEVENFTNITAIVGGRLEKLYIEEGQFVRKGQRIGYMSSDSRIRMLEMAAHKGADEVAYWRKQILPTYIFAPASGRVIDIRQRPGDKVSGAIARLSEGEVVRANIDEIDISKLDIGKDVFITFDLDKERTFVGKVKKISQLSKKINNVNVYPVEIQLPKLKELAPIKPKIGMSVTVDFPYQKIDQAISIASIAVNNESNKEMQVTLKDGTVRKVVLGNSYGQDVHVKEGLAAGDEVQVKVFKNVATKNKKSPLSLIKK